MPWDTRPRFLLGVLPSICFLNNITFRNNYTTKPKRQLFFLSHLTAMLFHFDLDLFKGNGLATAM